jgi:nicotinamide mononucleotide adenylyltransferase
MKNYAKIHVGGEYDQYLFKFENGYTASVVIDNKFEEDDFEVAVFNAIEEIIFNLPIKVERPWGEDIMGNDVIRHITRKQVNIVLKQIRKL